MKPFFLLYGFVAWLLATLIFRVAGQYLLRPDSPTSTALVFILGIPVLALLTYPVYAWKRLDAAQRRAAAVSLALPGMLADAFVMLFFQSVFPNMSPEADKYFGALMLWGYSFILLSGFVPGRAGELRT